MKTSAASVLSTLFAFGLAGSVIAAYTSVHGSLFQSANHPAGAPKSLVDPWFTGEPANIAYWPPKSMLPASQVYEVTEGYMDKADVLLAHQPYSPIPVPSVSGICGRRVTCPAGLYPVLTRALSTGDPGEKTQAWTNGSDLVIIRTARKGAARSRSHRPVVVLLPDVPAHVYAACR